MPSAADVTRVLNAASTVNDTLRQYPVTTAVFNRFGIDACCGGAASISEAATRDGADSQELLNALRLAIEVQDDSTSNAS